MLLCRCFFSVGAIRRASSVCDRMGIALKCSSESVCLAFSFGRLSQMHFILNLGSHRGPSLHHYEYHALN